MVRMAGLLFTAKRILRSKSVRADQLAAPTAPRSVASHSSWSSEIFAGAARSDDDPARHIVLPSAPFRCSPRRSGTLGAMPRLAREPPSPSAIVPVINRLPEAASKLRPRPGGALALGRTADARDGQLELEWVRLLPSRLSREATGRGFAWLRRNRGICREIRCARDRG